MHINIRLIAKIIIIKMSMSRVQPTIDNSGPYVPINSRYKSDGDFSSDIDKGKKEDVEYLENSEKRELLQD